MVNAEARKIVRETLDLRRRFPGAPVLDVLDLAMQGHHGADIDFADDTLATGNHTDVREAFGQLLAAAFDDVMSPLEWLNLLPQGDPEPLLEYWRKVIVGERFAGRYRL